MKNYGDPQSQMYRISSFLSEVYEDARLVNLTVGKPKPGNLTQIHDEVMKKLECMAYAHRCNAHIGGYPIPFCCETVTLQKIYTLQDLRAAGVITSLTTSAYPVTSRWPTSSEFEESDLTNTEGLHEVIEESTDTEMVQQTHTLMITSNREKVRLEALIREQDHTIDEVIRQVHECVWKRSRPSPMPSDTEKMGGLASNATAPLREEDVKRSREESPEYGSTPRERGCSLHHKSKSDIQYPASPGRRHLGSQSFTTFGHCSHSRPQSLSKHHSQSRSSTPGRSYHRDSTPHTSRKRPVAKTPKPTEATPMQSPAQKTPKLKSLVQRAPATKNYRDPPYHCLDKDPKEFIQYIMGNLDWKAYDAEIRCLATFYSQATVLARHVITSIITTLVVANRGIHFMVPVIPGELMSLPNNPSDAEPPGAPARSEDYQTDVRVHCIWEWTYLMCLLQYWYNASLVYTYGSPVRQESKLMLFAFYWINAMLNFHGLFIRMHELLDNTPWHHYYQART